MLKNLSNENITIFKVVSYITSLLPASIYILFEYLGDHKCIIENVSNLECTCKHIWLTPHNIAIFQGSIQCVALIIFLVIIYGTIKNGSLTNYERVSLRNISKERTSTTGYLLSNVVPIISLNISTVSGVVFTALILSFLGIMYVKNNLYFINPLYDLMGISSYNADILYLDDRGATIKNNKMQIISMVNLYDSDSTAYTAFEAPDILIIRRKE